MKWNVGGVIVVVVVDVLVHQAWDGCGSEIAVNTLAKGEPRVNTDSKPSGKPSSGSLLPGITAITVCDDSCRCLLPLLIQEAAVGTELWLCSCSKQLALADMLQQGPECLRLLATDKTTTRLPNFDLPILPAAHYHSVPPFLPLHHLRFCLYDALYLCVSSPATDASRLFTISQHVRLKSKRRPVAFRRKTQTSLLQEPSALLVPLCFRWR